MISTSLLYIALHCFVTSSLRTSFCEASDLNRRLPKAVPGPKKFWRRNWLFQRKLTGPYIQNQYSTLFASYSRSKVAEKLVPTKLIHTGLPMHLPRFMIYHIVPLELSYFDNMYSFCHSIHLKPSQTNVSFWRLNLTHLIWSHGQNAVAFQMATCEAASAKTVSPLQTSEAAKPVALSLFVMSDVFNVFNVFNVFTFSCFFDSAVLLAFILALQCFVCAADWCDSATHGWEGTKLIEDVWVVM